MSRVIHGVAVLGRVGLVEIQFSGCRDPVRASSPRELWDRKRESLGCGKLFHGEESPALQRNIIDTSERGRANYRYGIGHHFGLVNIYERPQRTCNFVQIF